MIVSAQSYGFDGAAIQRAINSFERGVVYIPPGRWVCNDQITRKSDICLIGNGDSTILDFSGATGSFPVACLYGNSGSLVELDQAFSKDIQRCERHITFAEVPSVAPNDILCISNTADYSWSNERSYWRQGEFCRVRGVSNNTVLLDGFVGDSYIHGETTRIYKVVNPNRGFVGNFQVIAKAGTTGLLEMNGYGLRIENIKGTGTNSALVVIKDSLNCTIKGINVVDYSAAAGTNYGLLVSNCQDLDIGNCNLLTTRHGFALGGEGPIVNRRIRVHHSVISSLGLTGGIAGYDNHGNAEDVICENNFLLNGAVMAGQGFVLQNNVIETTPSDGCGVYLYSMTTPNGLIKGNTIRQTAPTALGVVRALNFGSLKSTGTLRIVDNDIDCEGFGGTAPAIINLMNGESDISPNVMVLRNNIHNSTLASAKALNVQGKNGKTWGTITVDGNHFGALAMA